MRTSIKILAVLGLVAVGIQFFPASRTASATPFGPSDITVLYPTPPEVKTILAKSCYDCHSDNARYPWYARVQPVGWWMQYHIDEGRRELNFSQFGTYAPKRALHKLDEVVKETKAGSMPLTSYLLTHRDAKLSALEIEQLVAWADGIRAHIPAPAAP